MLDKDYKNRQHILILKLVDDESSFYLQENIIKKYKSDKLYWTLFLEESMLKENIPKKVIKTFKT